MTYRAPGLGALRGSRFPVIDIYIGYTDYFSLFFYFFNFFFSYFVRILNYLDRELNNLSIYVGP